MSKQNSIEEIIRHQLQGYEAPVPNHLWEQVKSGINSAPGQPSPSQPGIEKVVVKSTLKYWLISGAMVVASAGIYLWQSGTPGSVKTQNAPEINQPVEQQNSTQSGGQKNPVPSIEKNTVDYQPKTKENTPESPAKEGVNSPQKAENSASTKAVNSNSVAERSQTNGNDASVVKESAGTKSQTQASGVKASVSNQTAPTSSNSSNSGKIAESNRVQSSKGNTGQSSSSLDESAIISASTLRGGAPLDVKFSAPAGASNYSWDFGNGSVGNQQNAETAYQNPGDYKVVLTITNKDGKTDQTSAVVHVVESSTFFIPNTITPNGDNRNDYLKPEGTNIASVEISIYDLHGRKVFESNSMDRSWDGSDPYSQQTGESNYIMTYRALGTDGKVYKDVKRINVIR